ncbi:hypothetical protein AB7C87_20360 [Natrarchaeobius sp. A-rgal3]|uniref:hypothetical protein n=1 Tax=Natrarchaeobius versutus TaxID=1679078 RepID=UPI003510185E
MRSSRVIVLLVIAVVCGLTAAPAAAGDSTPPPLDSTSNESTEPGGNLSVSSFMQSSAADAENSVESGLFETKYENTEGEERAALVADRTAALETQLEALEAEREVLEEADENVSTGEYRARAAKLTIGIAALERSLERTIPRANETGVDENRLVDLRSNASELSGSAVAADARGIAGLGQFDDGPPGLAGDGNWTPPGQNESAPGKDGNWTPPGQAENESVGSDSALDAEYDDHPATGSDGDSSSPASDTDSSDGTAESDANAGSGDDDSNAGGVADDVTPSDDTDSAGDAIPSENTNSADDSIQPGDGGPPDRSGENERQDADAGSNDT